MPSLLGRINALTNADISNGDAAEGYVEQWLRDGIKEIVGFMPVDVKYKCGIEGSAFAPTTGQTMDNEILDVIRGTLVDGETFIKAYHCRQIPYTRRFDAQDEDNLLFATVTDPAYFLEPQGTGSSPKVKVLPGGTASIAKITSVDYHSDTLDPNGDEGLDNFPDDWEHIVVLYAAIKTAEYLLALEEDDDLYVPIIATLRQDYMTSLQAKGAQVAGTKKATGGSNKQMKDLVSQLQEAGLVES